MTRLLSLAMLLLPLMVLAALPAGAIGVDEPLQDAALEARARAIMSDIRCLVCQNQSIEDSNAELAQDLRQIVREKIVAGEDEAQIHSYLVERYGDWILMEPPLVPKTYILWLGPFALLVLGAGALLMSHRKQSRQAVAALNPQERARARALMDEEGDAP
jgi:cytochrome c-type biogenesis protein CcmH